MSQQSQTQTSQPRAAGCFSILSGAFTGAMAGVIATLFGLGPIVGLVIAVAVAWLAIRSLSKPTPTTPPHTKESGIQPDVRLADGSALRDARGQRTSGGREADTARQGGVIVTVPFTPQGANADTLITMLNLSDGRIGYRDGLVIEENDTLIVHAMARLTSDVEATGDDDVGAAPVGRIDHSAWQPYPLLSERPTLVQVALSVTSDGSRHGWILFALHPSARPLH
jgi:hypothetical protein